MKINRPTFFRTCCLALAFLLSGLSPALLADNAPAKLVAGSKLARLTIGATTYHNVVVRSVSARSAMITHDSGMKSILLRDLTPDLQKRFGYNPEADRAEEAAAKAGQANAEKQQQARLEAMRKSQASLRNAGPGLSKIDHVLRAFGKPPEVAEEVDLRPRFNELGLWVKDQGHRPSCAVFAIVSTLEFQNAEATGTAKEFSEEYLFWATCKSLDRIADSHDTPDEMEDENDQTDAGFSLQEVVTALYAYGIPTRNKVPNRLGGKAIDNPPEELIAEARSIGRTTVHTIPGHNGATLANNVIHALNLGIPVPIGLRWPDGPGWRSVYLNDQTTSANHRHAVTLVGYRCKTGRVEDAEFIFKNSWGLHWGQAGYGTATYAYLTKNLHAAVVLEVQPGNK